MIVALAGGVGAARFLKGLVRVVDPHELTVVVNTGDDDCFYGLLVCPDLDTITYNLAGATNEVQGWGLKHDTYNVLDGLRHYGHDTWFNLGDRDIATHLHRTLLLEQGASLTEATDSIRKAWGVQCKLLPMSNEQVATRVVTSAGTLPMQEYFVKRRATDTVEEVVYEGVNTAKPAPGVVEAITAADGIVVCPSNPFLSILPMLSIHGVREALRTTQARITGISPIVAGAALKGPADKMMRSLVGDASAAAVANLYREFLDSFIVDRQDAGLAPQIEAMGIKAIVTNTIMSSPEFSANLARIAINALGMKP